MRNHPHRGPQGNRKSKVARRLAMKRAMDSEPVIEGGGHAPQMNYDSDEEPHRWRRLPDDLVMLGEDDFNRDGKAEQLLFRMLDCGNMGRPSRKLLAKKYRTHAERKRKVGG